MTETQYHYYRHQIWLVTAMSHNDAHEVIRKIAKNVGCYSYNLEQALNLYLMDMRHFGQPCFTAHLLVD